MLLHCNNYAFASYWLSTNYKSTFLLYCQYRKIEQLFSK